MSTAPSIADLQRIFEEVANLPANQRAARLESLCQGNTALRDQLARMLAADSETAHAIDKPAIDDSTLLEVTGPSPTSVTPVTHIGRYAIERVLGEGGMGVVYLANQTSPQRLVAIKVIRSIAPSPDLIKRFEREASVLARLSHPGIAQIYDSGSAPIFGTRPVPYLVLEYIDGTPLLAHTTSANLNESAKLRIFIDICRAVQYAHQRGVIHRDLKPSNILIQRITGSSTNHQNVQSKILDFGVARTLEDTNTRHTQAGALIGTLSYMSPEQVTGTLADTRSDVYALGVILYELLSGSLPIDIRSDTIIDATRKIRDVEPARLARVLPAIAPDLDAITSKSIEKDPALRYQSAGELADDLERYLANLPVLAQPHSTLYQLRKFAARNRVIVAASAAVVTSILAFGGIAAWQAVKATRASKIAAAEAARAEAQAQRAEAVKNYLVRDLVRAGVPGGDSTDGKSPSITDYFDRALKRLPTAFPENLDLQGEIRSEIGYSLAFAGNPTKAVIETRAALAQLSASAGDNDLRTIRARVSLADVLQVAGQNEESTQIADVAIAELRSLSPPQPDLLGQALILRAELASNASEFDRVEPLLREIESLPLKPRSELPLSVLSTRCGMLMGQEQWSQAEAVARQLLEQGDRFLGPSHPQMLAAATNLIVCLGKQNKFDEASQFAPSVLARAEETFGPNHPTLGFVLLNVGGIYSRTDRQADAMSAFLRAREIFVTNFDDYRYEVERVSTGLLRVAANMHDLPATTKWADDLVRIRFGVANKDERDGLAKRFELNYAQTSRAGLPETAQQQLVAFIAKVDQFTPINHPRRARTLANLARAAQDMNRPDLASDLCAKAREALAYASQREADQAILAQTPCTP